MAVAKFVLGFVLIGLWLALLQNPTRVEGLTNAYFSSQCPTLLISQIYHTSSPTNRFIELYNYGEATVNLTGLSLGQWSNAARQDFTTGVAPSINLPLTGFVPSGRTNGTTWVVGTVPATAPTYVVVNTATTLTYGGDDSVILILNDYTGTRYYCDIISITTTSGTLQRSYYRNPSVTAISATYDNDYASGWTQAASISAVNSASAGTTLYIGYHAMDAPPVPASFSLTSWNIQVFGLTKLARTDVMDIVLSVLKRYDLIAIQEIRDSSGTAFPQLMTQLNARVAAEYKSSSSCCEGPVVYEYVVSDRLGSTSSKEQYAIIYNRRVFSVLNTYQYAAGVSGVFERPPYAALINVRNASPAMQFALIDIHTDPDHAAREIDALVDAYDATLTYFGASNAIVLGDYNAGCTYFSIADKLTNRFWNDTRVDWLIGDRVDTTTSVSTVCAYDRFVVSGGLTAGGFVNLTTPALFDFQAAYGLTGMLTADVSDHFPITMQLRTSAVNGLKLNRTIQSPPTGMQTNRFFGSACPKVFFSQYYEGATTNKNLELFNYGTSSVGWGSVAVPAGPLQAFAGQTVQLYLGQFTSSSGASPNRQGFRSRSVPHELITLSGSIAASSTFTVGRFAASPAPTYLPATVSQLDSVGSLTYGGDDSLVLFYTLYGLDYYCDIVSLASNAGPDKSFVRDPVSTKTISPFYSDDFGVGWVSPSYTLAAVNSASATTLPYVGYHAL